MLLRSERAKGNRYFLIQKKATLEDVERIRRFPILNLGRYRGGVRVIQRSERKKTFRDFGASNNWLYSKRCFAGRFGRGF